MSNFRADNKKDFSGNKKEFFVEKKLYLDFTQCTVDNYPKNKVDFKRIIETFAAFGSKNDLKARDDHELDKKDIGNKAERIMPMIREYKKVKSLDVYHRQGKNGKMRLLYSPDPDDSSIVYILDCFIDTH